MQESPTQSSVGIEENSKDNVSGGLYWPELADHPLLISFIFAVAIVIPLSIGGTLMGMPSWVSWVIAMFMYFFLSFLGHSMQGSETHKKRKKLEEATCPKCGAKVPAGAGFCPQCGEKFEKKSEEKLFCSKCGLDVSPNDKFCSTCGEKLE